MPTLVGFMVQKTRAELNEIAEKFQTRNKSNMKTVLWFHRGRKGPLYYFQQHESFIAQIAKMFFGSVFRVFGINMIFDRFQIFRSVITIQTYFLATRLMFFRIMRL